MVDFMSTWLGHECPDIWPNVILSVSKKVFLDEINILIGKSKKQIDLHNVVGPDLIS